MSRRGGTLENQIVALRFSREIYRKKDNVNLVKSQDIFWIDYVSLTDIFCTDRELWELLHELLALHQHILSKYKI